MVEMVPLNFKKVLNINKVMKAGLKSSQYLRDFLKNKTNQTNLRSKVEYSSQYITLYILKVFDEGFRTIYIL